MTPYRMSRANCARCPTRNVGAMGSRELCVAYHTRHRQTSYKSCPAISCVQHLLLSIMQITSVLLACILQDAEVMGCAC
eukprot:3623799-Amphidinium_carterae.1